MVRIASIIFLLFLLCKAEPSPPYVLNLQLTNTGPHQVIIEEDCYSLPFGNIFRYYWYLKVLRNGQEIEEQIFQAVDIHAPWPKEVFLKAYQSRNFTIILGENWDLTQPGEYSIKILGRSFFFPHDPWRENVPYRNHTILTRIIGDVEITTEEQEEYDPIHFQPDSPRHIRRDDFESLYDYIHILPSEWYNFTLFENNTYPVTPNEIHQEIYDKNFAHVDL